MDIECACGCGRIIQGRKKTPRERIYYSPACRQRASRARNKDTHDRERIMQAAFERQWNAIEQDVRRESWQDALAFQEHLVIRREKEIKALELELEMAKLKTALLEEEMKLIKDDLAEKDAEIIRLTTLLNAPSRKTRR